MAAMAAVFEWDKVMRIDPLNLHGCEKDQLDEVFSMFTLVIVHASHQYSISNICSVAQPPTLLWGFKLHIESFVYFDMFMGASVNTMSCWSQIIVRIVTFISQWPCQWNVPIRLFCFNHPLFLVSLLTWVTHIALITSIIFMLIDDQYFTTTGLSYCAFECQWMF